MREELRLHSGVDVVEGASSIESVEIVASSQRLGWEGVNAYVCWSGPKEPLRVLTTSHIVSTPLACNFDVEWRCDGRQKRISLEPGLFSLFPAHQEHQFRLVGRPLALNWQIEHAWLLGQAEREVDRSVASLAIWERFCVKDPDVVALAGVMVETLREGDQLAGRLRAETLQASLVARLLLAHSSLSYRTWSGRGVVSPRRLRGVIEMMHYGCPESDDLSLGRLANEAGLSPYHFARQFKQVTGRTPHQFLLAIRVERAKGLLADRRFPLSEVAIATGFSSQSHLTATFRRFVGVTPGLYRVAVLGSGDGGTGRKSVPPHDSDRTGGFRRIS